MPALQDERIALSIRVDRVTYSDATTGFAIVQAAAVDDGRPITAVGNLMAPVPGMILDVNGHWETHHRFGRQLRVNRVQQKPPVTEAGIEQYLGSGFIKGVGPEMAHRIVTRFGADTLDVIDTAPQRLTEVTGIGPKRAALIRDAWNAQTAVRDVMLFLQSHGISAGFAAKMIQRYGTETVHIVQTNPYRLAEDIFGIGFRKADAIARQLGFGADSSERVQAGITFALRQLANDGHLYYPRDMLVAHATSLLDTGAQPVEAAIDKLGARQMVVIEQIASVGDAASKRDQAVFLTEYYLFETRIADHLHRLMQAASGRRLPDAAAALAWIQKHLNLRLGEDQQAAVSKALHSKVMVITGGPGTGKTTVIRAITRALERHGRSVLQAAPTGRAAKRLSEATGRPAKTIHRLLKYNPHQDGFSHDAKNPLDVDLLVLDEVSMIDAELMAHLLEAIPTAAALILVGDVNQLPSVGPGNVLKDILASATIAHVTLQRIFRQARESRIVTNAHRMNNGQMPVTVDSRTDGLGDFYFIEQRDPKTIHDTLLTLVRDRIPARFGFDPVEDIQVLTPMHKGIIGAAHLNRSLQHTLNQREDAIERGAQRFGLGDKVMQIRNNYEKDVYNGDIGRIQSFDPKSKQVIIRYDGRRIPYAYEELNEVVLAYAISIHKSQGSEYPAVVIPISTQHYILLQRNLIYTAVTRARKLVVLVGTRQAMGMAIGNDTPKNRYTRLAKRLQAASTGAIA